MITEEDKITIKNTDGMVKEFYKLIEFIDKKTNKNFIIYTDNEYDDGKLNIYSSVVEKKDTGIAFLPVTDEEDMEKVKKALVQVKSSLN